MKRHALISVSDKTGIVELAKTLATGGYSILSTGGTARVLRDSGLEVTDVSEYTGFPEMMDGRVKTLHPKVHGGLLARRDDETHVAAMAEHGIDPIDVVVVNLYPFRETVAKPGVTLAEAVEQIDIGGPSMLRSAAKNHASVTVVVDPADYGRVSEAVAAGDIPAELRARLAAKVFQHTAAYDAAIAAYLTRSEQFPAELCVMASLASELRYGENPHQRAAFYRLPDAAPGSVAAAEVLGGKQLSYNNLLDVDAAWGLACEFDPGETAACAIIKHGNPCGAAIAPELEGAYAKALECDPVSAFGSIVACNVRVTEAAAARMAGPGTFIEAIIAPGYDDAALELLRSAKFGKNLRIVDAKKLPPREPSKLLRSISGGVLVQDQDPVVSSLELETVTERAPSDAEIRDLRFGWKVAKHVRSNAIVLAKDGCTVGVGAGQMSRVDSVEIACRKAGDRASGAALASDAFFPFPDGVEVAAQAGVESFIQPGGSRKDKVVIEAANKLGVSMVLTGTRHFKH